MKILPSKLICIPAALGFALLAAKPVAAADAAPAPGTPPAAGAAAAPVTTALNHIVEAINSKLKQGQISETALADELKQFDALFAAHKDEKTDAVAEILYVKASLYAQVLRAPDKALPLLQQLKTDFPATKIAKAADPLIAALTQQAAATKIQRDLAVGTKFPDFNVNAVDGKVLSVGGDKGKVILIDFWATWCGPCVAEIPNVMTAYTKYHGKGFDIIGVSLDREKTPLTAFIQDKKVTWPQYYDEKGDLAKKYGISVIPSSFLLDSEGKIIAKDLRGEDLDKAVAAALAK